MGKKSLVENWTYVFVYLASGVPDTVSSIDHEVSWDVEILTGEINLI